MSCDRKCKKIKSRVNLIIGASGQLGRYLAGNLRERGETIVQVNRRSGRFDCTNSDVSAQGRLVDITDPHGVNKLFQDYSHYYEVHVYHAAAQSHVGLSFSDPAYTMNVNVQGTLNVLEAIKNYCSHAKMVFCASSEMFGYASEKYRIQDENTPMWPRSPYAISKLAGYHLVRNYREAYNLNLWNSINFNFESPLRGHQFVTRKVTSFFASLVNETNLAGKILEMGNIDAVRDWSHASDIAEGMRLMLTSGRPTDYVLASGAIHTVKDIIHHSCSFVNELRDARGLPKIVDPMKHIALSGQFIRPSDLSYLHGNPASARSRLGWRPKYDFKSLITEMIVCDLASIEGRK